MSKDVQPTVASPVRGRRTMQAETADAELVATGNYEAGAASLVAGLRQESIALPKTAITQSLRMAEAVGRISAFQFNETMNRVAMLKLFQEVRDSRSYKGATVIMRSSGEVVTVTTWEDFCVAHGFSHKKINEDLQNLATFGGDFLELQDKLGLGYRELRLLRKGLSELPPEERQAVLADVADADGPDEVREKLEDLRLDLAKAQAKEKELQADLAAKEKVSRSKTEKLDDLAEQVARLTSSHPDDKAKLRIERNANSLKLLDEACTGVTRAVLALCAQGSAILADEDSTDDTCMQVHRRVSILAEFMADGITRSGIDVDLAAWMQHDAPASVTEE